MSFASAVEEYVKKAVPANIKKDISDLTANLYYGPGIGTWSDEVIDRVKEYVDGFPSLYYVDYLDEVTDNPDFSDEDETCSIMEVDSTTVCRAILGKELYNTIY